MKIITKIIKVDKYVLRLHRIIYLNSYLLTIVIHSFYKFLLIVYTYIVVIDIIFLFVGI